MEIESLEVALRDKSVTARALRRQGFIPAEYYGGGVENLSLQMDYQTFRKLYRRTGENTIVELTVGDDGKKFSVLVHDIELHPVTDEIQHVDFIDVKMDEEVHTHIPLEFVGVAPAVKELGGVFSSHYNEVEIKCLPKYLVHSIEVDVSVLEDFHSSIHFGDLEVPDGIEMISNPELIVCAVSAPRIEEGSADGEEVMEGVGGEVEEGAEGSVEEAKEGDGGGEKKE